MSPATPSSSAITAQQRRPLPTMGTSPDEHRYEVSVPFDQDIKKLARIIKRLDGRDGAVGWEIKEYMTVRT
jgi:hypothetical protein